MFKAEKKGVAVKCLSNYSNKNKLNLYFTRQQICGMSRTQDNPCCAAAHFLVSWSAWTIEVNNIFLDQPAFKIVKLLDSALGQWMLLLLPLTWHFFALGLYWLQQHIWWLRTHLTFSFQQIDPTELRMESWVLLGDAWDASKLETYSCTGRKHAQLQITHPGAELDLEAGHADC